MLREARIAFLFAPAHHPALRHAAQDEVGSRHERHLGLRALQRAAGREAAKELLTTLGVDVSKPLEVQKDFAFVRTMRMGSHWGARAAFTGIITAIATALVGWLWLAFTRQHS